MPETMRCSRCSRTMSADSAVHLWDARDYCRDCVEAACPGLANYARTHSVLEERVAAHSAVVAGGPTRKTLWAALALMSLAMIAAWAAAALGEFDFTGTAGVLAYVAFFFVPIVLALGLSLASFDRARTA